MAKYYLETQKEIQAPLEKVWLELTSFQNYHLWNAFIPEISGDFKVGSILDIVIKVPDEKEKKYKVKLQNIKNNHSFSWLGHFIFPGIIDGHHVFEIHALNANSSLLIHKEHFSGILVPFVWNSFLNTKLRSGFEILNAGLKKYLEN